MLYLYNNLILEGNNWRQFKEDLPADEVIVLEELDSAPLLWFAGDKDFTSKTLKEISKESYSNWLKSLKSSSVFFYYSLNLVPIHLLAANQIKIAFESLLTEENTAPYYGEDDIDVKCLRSELRGGGRKVSAESALWAPGATLIHYKVDDISKYVRPTVIIDNAQKMLYKTYYLVYLCIRKGYHIINYLQVYRSDAPSRT